MRRWLVLAATILSLVFAAPAAARGGHYAFAGGTASQQAQVRSALAASAFDFDLVPAEVTIHIGRVAVSQAQPGHIWLGSRLLDAGRFAWATVQDEYAHQIDYFLLDDSMRLVLLRALGGSDWCYAMPGLAHADYGCERFSSVFAWAYWPSAANAYRPTSSHDESAAMAPAKFRALLGSLIGFADPLAAKLQPLSGRK